jgi:preprotein translocase subunit SecY
MLNMFTGGAVGRMGDLRARDHALHLGLDHRAADDGDGTGRWLAQLKKEGEAGRKKLNQYTRYGTVFLATFQAYGLAIGLEAGAGRPPGLVLPHLEVVITLVGGTMFLMWLGEQITARGIGNGISLIIFVGIIAELPAALAQFFTQGRTGAISPAFVVGILVMAIAVITFVVFMERALRKINIQYPKRQVGMKVYGGESSHLPVKVNPAGVIPAIFASSLLLLPATVTTFSGSPGAMPEAQGGFWDLFQAYLGRGQPLQLLLFGGLIIFFTYFYTANVSFKSDDVADNLRKQGGFVPGIRPGQKTVEYLDYVVSRILVVGSAYLAAVCLLPEILIAELAVPFYFGGTSLLIVVSVTMDTISQVQSHMLAHQYEGLIEKSRLRGRGRGGKTRR